jgi:hypothetical protein
MQGLRRFIIGGLKMPVDRSALVVATIALVAVPTFAISPPPPKAANLLPLSTTGCPIDVIGSVQPYSPVIYRFQGSAEDTLVIFNAKLDQSLNFSFGIMGEPPLITGAGFGADVRIRLPRSGVYQLDVSSFDPVQMKALAADFNFTLALRGEVIPQSC